MELSTATSPFGGFNDEGVGESFDSAGPAGQMGMCLLGMAVACDEGPESKDMAPRADAGRWGGAGRVRAIVAMLATQGWTDGGYALLSIKVGRERPHSKAAGRDASDAMAYMTPSALSGPFNLRQGLVLL